MAAAAILNNKKSPYVSRHWSDLVEIWHSEVVRPSWRVRLLEILKCTMAAAAILKNRHIAGIRTHNC